MLLAAYNPIIFSVDINVLCHLEIKGFIQPKSDVSIIVGFNKDILCAKRLQSRQSLRKGALDLVQPGEANVASTGIERLVYAIRAYEIGPHTILSRIRQMAYIVDQHALICSPVESIPALVVVQRHVLSS